MTHMIESELDKELTIEQIKNKLFYLDSGFPKEAVLAAIDQKSSIIPILIACLSNAIENCENLEDGFIGQLFAVFLLSQFKEKSAFPLMIQLARLPEDKIDFLIGDCITEHLHRFIASTYNGDLDAIKNLIEDTDVNQWSRNAGVGALVTLANHGHISIDETVRYISTLFESDSFIDDYDQITHLVGVCCDFYPERFYHEVQKAFEDQKVDGFSIGWDDFKQSLSQQKSHVVDNFHTFIEDTIAEMEHWHCFEDADSNDNHTSDFFSSSNWFENLPSSIVSKQIVRGTPKIGRNEPCPCNSGKKYKKCCLLQQ